MSAEERTVRLFLGGPLHGRRLVVDREAYQHSAPAPLSPIFAAEPEEFSFDEGRVTYTLRRAPGGREQVFIAPDYSYDTPEWLAYDTKEWASRIRPDHTDWEWLDRWLWRGKTPEFKMSRYWSYLLGDGRGETHIVMTVTDEVARAAGSWAIDELRHELAYRLLPACVVEDCDEKGHAVFVSAERGRLAGREWRKGDEIRLCPKHAQDVYRAQGVFGIDQLAEWLRPDAEARRDDLYCVAASIRYGPDSITRMMRLAQKVEG
jgi:hypothetical protein